MFYGNGTVRLVRDSEWRERGAGVPDPGSHLLDAAKFGLASQILPWFRPGAENRAPRPAIIASRPLGPARTDIVALLAQHYTCDILVA
jgi:hypothetical protein